MSNCRMSSFSAPLYWIRLEEDSHHCFTYLNVLEVTLVGATGVSFSERHKKTQGLFEDHSVLFTSKEIILTVLRPLSLCALWSFTILLLFLQNLYVELRKNKSGCSCKLKGEWSITCCILTLLTFQLLCIFWGF